MQLYTLTVVRFPQASRTDNLMGGDCCVINACVLDTVTFGTLGARLFKDATVCCFYKEFPQGVGYTPCCGCLFGLSFRIVEQRPPG